jgi:hypothetical protein
MKTKTKLRLAGISVAVAIAGVALATPTIGLIHNVILVTERITPTSMRMRT